MYVKYTELNEKQKLAKKEAVTKYEKTKKGFLVRLYRNMKSRIEGVQRVKHHLYKDKELIAKDEFYTWALSSEDFHSLFERYEASGYERKRAPSVDRIDANYGYTLKNIQFITMSDNSSKNTLNRQVRVNGVDFPTYTKAAVYLKISRPTFQYLVERAKRKSTFLSQGIWELVVFLEDGETLTRISKEASGE